MPVCSNCGGNDFVWADSLRTGTIGRGTLSLRSGGELALGTRICRGCGHADLFVKDPTILRQPHTWRPGEFVPIPPRPATAPSPPKSETPSPMLPPSVPAASPPSPPSPEAPPPVPAPTVTSTAAEPPAPTAAATAPPETSPPSTETAPAKRTTRRKSSRSKQSGPSVIHE